MQRWRMEVIQVCYLPLWYWIQTKLVELMDINKNLHRQGNNVK